MTEEPVTVAVVNYQGSTHLPAVLPAVSALEGRIAERILVDSGSTDGSVDLVRRTFPEFRVIELGSNLGPAAARNRALREARTRLVLLLDNDVVPGPDGLRRLLAALGPGVAAVCPRALLEADPARIHYDGAHFHYVGLFALRNFYGALETAGEEGPVEVDGAVALALLLDRAASLEVGGFAEEYFFAFEDLDFSYRLRASGRRILAVPAVRVLHRGGTAGLSFRSGDAYGERRTFLHARNRWLFLLRNYRARTLLAAAPGIALYEALAFVLALAGGNLGAFFRGRFEALRAIPRARRERREFERLRRLPDRALLRGRPLSVTPSVRAGALRSALHRSVEAALAAWWAIGRRLAG